MAQKWIGLVNPNSGLIKNEIDKFVEKIGTPINGSVFDSLSRSSQVLLSPSSFLMSHETYLYGVFNVPTSSSDGIADFIEVAMLVSENSLLTIIKAEISPDSVSAEFAKCFNDEVDRFNQSTLGIGSAVVKVIELATDSLTNYLMEIKASLSNLSSNFELDSKLGDKVTSASNLGTLGSALGICERELLSIGPVLLGLNQVASEVANDNLDLRLKNGAQLFPQELEIESQMLRLRVSQLDQIHHDSVEYVAALYRKLGVQFSEANSRKIRFVSAVALMFVSPILLLNVYGSFFAEGERWSSSFSSQFFWVPILCVLIIELIYFRKIKWLKS